MNANKTLNMLNDSVFELTSGMDMLNGSNMDDTFVGTYNNAGTGTFGATDIINGGDGVDTLNIVPIGVAAITPPDNYWAHVSNIEKILINTSGAGAQTITTGAAFEAAFAQAGVDLNTTSNGGAITIDSSSFTGSANFTSSSGAGAQTISTGSGSGSVNASSDAGALTITGSNLSSVTATSIAGAQTITTGVGLATITANSDAGAQTIIGANLSAVTATAGAGAQTIISTGEHAVTVVATSGVGATTVVTGAGNDQITLLASDAGGLNAITAGTGADTITLVAGALASPDSITIGQQDSGITLVSADHITGFDSGSDFLKMGVASTAVNYAEADLMVANFDAAKSAADAAFAQSFGVQQYSFQWDGTNGYLFNDINGDGSADQVVVLVGVTNMDFAASNIVV